MSFAQVSCVKCHALQVRVRGGPDVIPPIPWWHHGSRNLGGDFRTQQVFLPFAQTDEKIGGAQGSLTPGQQGTIGPARTRQSPRGCKGLGVEIHQPDHQPAIGPCSPKTGRKPRQQRWIGHQDADLPRHCGNLPAGEPTEADPRPQARQPPGNVDLDHIHSVSSCRRPADSGAGVSSRARQHGDFVPCRGELIRHIAQHAARRNLRSAAKAVDQQYSHALPFSAAS